MGRFCLAISQDAILKGQKVDDAFLVTGTDTSPMQLNQGIFEMNGRSGYLLKPECMRRKDRHFDPFEENSVENVVAHTVSVLVLSGQFLSRNRVSTYVEIELYGLPVDCVIKKGDRFKTKVVHNNGINPVYADHRDARPFEIPKIVLPELASIRFIVYEENRQSMIGHRILPIVALRPGYRHISLRNAMGQPLGLPTLFVKISVKDFVPLAHLELVLALRDPIAYVNRMNAPIKDIADALVNPIEYRKKMEKRDQLLKEMFDDDFQQQQKKELAKSESDNTIIPPNEPVSKQFSNGNIGPAKPPTLPSFPQINPPRSIGFDPSKMHTPDIPRIRRTSNANFQGGGKNIIETYHFSLPSLEMFVRDKKINRRCKQHDKDMKVLRDKHDKEMKLLTKKQDKKMSDLQKSHQKSLSLIAATNERLIKRPGPTDNIDELRSQTGRKEETLKREQAEEIQALQLQQEKDKRGLSSRHWKDEWTLVQEQHAALLTWQLNTVEQSLKLNLRTLETLYQKEISSVMKTNENQRKAEWEKLQKTAADKEQFAKQKKDAENLLIQKGVEQRKILETYRSSKEEDINKTCQDMKERLQTNHDLKLDELRKYYDDKIVKGDYQANEVTPL